jgi:hypothetical protein
MSLGTCRESCAFLMTHVNPVYRTISPQSVRESIQRVSYDTEHTLYARIDQCTDHIVGSYRCHPSSPKSKDLAGSFLKGHAQRIDLILKEGLTKVHYMNL